MGLLLRSRSKLNRLNGTIVICGYVTLENAPQLVQNDAVVAENDHFDDKALTEESRRGRCQDVGVLTELVLAICRCRFLLTFKSTFCVWRSRITSRSPRNVTIRRDSSVPMDFAL